jgi:branched-chain amino acid transport system substrate-binding protein
MTDLTKSALAAKWNDPKRFPWTMGFQPPFLNEGRVYSPYLPPTVQTEKSQCYTSTMNARRKGLDDVAEANYECSVPTIDSRSFS